MGIRPVIAAKIEKPDEGSLFFKSWRFHPPETLRGAIAANQYLKVFVASGYYDGATPFFGSEYTFWHTALGGELRERVKFGYYEAGHVMYINKSAHNKLMADLSGFIKMASGAN